ncbi:MAG: Murein hydrolase activator EnvC [Candidatus Dichloromethanomonas elyunquensis]|nr:MAG: Murein hydrolase activator EnvC [Candidatus Dichloromethanomonas elyunquensis]
MNPFERWDDWEWEKAAQAIGRDHSENNRDYPRGKRYYFNQSTPKNILEQLNGSQKRVILSALFFLTVVFSTKGEDFLSQSVHSVYKNSMDSGNLYTSLNSMAKEAMGVPNQESTPVNNQIQGIFYPPVAGPVKVGFQGKNFEGALSQGIEIESSLGTPVFCPNEGIVLESSQNNMFGKYIKINFGNGWEGVIGNLGEVSIKKGDPVSMGLRIGTVGINGSRQKPWLYLELSKNGKPVNPIPYLIQSK